MSAPRDARSSEPKASDRYDARQQLRQSVDALADRASLYTQMQKDPLKMIGGASGVGLALGLLVGRRFSRTRKIYVDETLSPKEQKVYEKTQQRLHREERSSRRGGIGGALVAAATTVAIKVLQERFLVPHAERLADQLAQRATPNSTSTPPTLVREHVTHEHGPRRPM